MFKHDFILTLNFFPLEFTCCLFVYLVFASSTQFANENSLHSRIMPLDNMNANTPSRLGELNKNNSCSNANNTNANVNIGVTSDALGNLNLNGNSGSIRQGVSNLHGSLLSVLISLIAVMNAKKRNNK